MSITVKLTKNLFFIYVTNIKDQFYIVRVCECFFAALLVFMFNIYIFIIFFFYGLRFIFTIIFIGYALFTNSYNILHDFLNSEGLLSLIHKGESVIDMFYLFESILNKPCIKSFYLNFNLPFYKTIECSSFGTWLWADNHINYSDSDSDSDSNSNSPAGRECFLYAPLSQSLSSPLLPYSPTH